MAKAVSPDTYGRSTNFVFHAVDAGGSCTDPAHQAFALPVLRWVTALWEGWVDAEELAKALSAAGERLAAAKASVWQVVAGPAAAFLATLREFRCEARSASVVVDDLGVEWNLWRHSPAALKKPLKLAVRRWRFAKMCVEMPSICEGLPAPDSRGGGERVMHIDNAAALAPLLRGARARVEGVPRWDVAHCAWLTSAVAGGQWPQVRRSSVPRWEVDSTCRLCHSAVGTLEHRHVCAATRPENGWVRHGAQGERLLSSFAPARRRVLRTRGVAALAVTVQSPRSSVAVNWLTDAPDPTDSTLRWFTDGSLTCPRWPAVTSAAAALVVVSAEGRLVAYAEVELPSTVISATAAEAHGVLAAFAHCVTPPRVVTDCKSLVTVAATGTARATAASAPLGGIWRCIASTFGSDVRGLIDDGRLVWMPAHLAAGTAAYALMSNGREVTFVAWRANRLADAIAKRCAARMLADPRVTRQLPQAMGTFQAEAAALGAVTHAANNHRVAAVRPDGTTAHVVARDADTENVRPNGVAARPWRRRTPQPPAEPRAVSCEIAEPRRSPRRVAAVDAQRATRARNVRRRAADDLAVRYVLAETGARARSRNPSPRLSPNDVARFVRDLAAPLAGAAACDASRDGSAAVATLDADAPPPRMAAGATPPAAVAPPATGRPAARVAMRTTASDARSARARSGTPRPALGLAELVNIHSAVYRSRSRPNAAVAQGRIRTEPPGKGHPKDAA